MGDTHKTKHAKCSSSILDVVGTERESKVAQRRERENGWARD